MNSILLRWAEGAGPLTYYLVAYGLTSGSLAYGNPNIGGAGTTAYTVNNLSGGTRYYFQVRAGNGCAPGDFSNTLSAIPTGGTRTAPATGFEPGVLGAETAASPSPSSSPASALSPSITPTPASAVLGASTFGWLTTLLSSWWFWTIIILLVGYLVYRRWFAKPR